MVRSVSDRWVLVILLLLLLRYAWLSTYVHPFGDDWSYAVKGREQGLWDALVQEYLHWNGRYFSNVLVLRGPLLLGMGTGLWVYRLMPMLLVAAMVLATRLLLADIVGAMLTSLRKWCAALGFTALYLHLMPHPGQGLFWYTGAVTYLVPCILLLLWGTVLFRTARAQGRWGRMGWAGLALLLMAAVAGSNEVAMVHALIVAACWAWSQRGRVPVLMLLAAFLCAAVVTMAPGNVVRSGHFVGTQDLVLTATMGVAQTIRFVAWWILSPAFLLVTFAIWRWAHGSAPHDALFRSLARLHPARVSIIALFAVVPAFAIPYWSTGMLGQHRTANAALFVLLPLLWLAMLSWRARTMERTSIPPAPFWEKHPAWPLITLACCLCFLRNDGAITSDLLTGRAMHADRQAQERYALVREAAASGADTVKVPMITDPPRSLDLLELREDPDHWMNTSLAQYLGAPWLKVVAVQASHPPRMSHEEL